MPTGAKRNEIPSNRLYKYKAPGCRQSPTVKAILLQEIGDAEHNFFNLRPKSTWPLQVAIDHTAEFA
jgi:hypothetical protein